MTTSLSELFEPPPSGAPVIAVTGSTGALGGQVARLLTDAGVPLRLPARSPARVPALQGAEPVPFSGYADHDSAVEALTGVDVLFMVSASESADRLGEHRSFVAAAADAGVQHVVYTSFLSASPDCTFTLGRDHAATEDAIRASGMQWTFLRDNFYLDFFAHLAGEDDVIRGPAGRGRCSAVAREDVARCAARVLRDLASDLGAHAGVTYDLTGPQALDLFEVAELVARHTGRPVTYHDETVEEAYESRRQWVAPDWQYDAWVSTYTAIAAGELDLVSDDVQRLTGRAPLGLADLLSR
jgi:NAD(P)H dehydrogenase (quinone)